MSTGAKVGRDPKRRPRRHLAPISKFARSLLTAWQDLELPSSTVGAIVAVSGGADSVALLLALDELIKARKLNIRIVIAHLDHRLRKASSEDARWVKELGESLGYTVSTKRADVAKLASRSGDNLEQAARVARYKWLAVVAQKSGANLVLTAHTMDDQAETVLMNLLRGSGADGLSGMESRRSLGPGRVKLARPLLSWARRQDTEAYCKARKVDFRRDEMNEDQTFARVRVRRQLLPVMETFNPRICEALARTAELMRDDSRALDAAAQRLLDLSCDNNAKANQIHTDLLADAPPALRRRALRLWLDGCRGNLRRLELVHFRAVEDLVMQNRGGRTIELPGGSTVSRKRGLLTLNLRTSRRAKA